MTLSTTRQQLPDQMFIHESPNSSSTDLAELGLPQPAFRRRSNASGTGLSSNRSSMHSLTSEELWKMDQEANQPDLSNPTRQAKERPLDTVRRMSKGYDLPTMSHLPGEVICTFYILFLSFPFVPLDTDEQGHQLWIMNRLFKVLPHFDQSRQRASLKLLNSPRNSRFGNVLPRTIPSIQIPMKEYTYTVPIPSRDPNQ